MPRVTFSPHPVLGKPVKIRRCPATVWGDDGPRCHRFRGKGGLRHDFPEARSFDTRGIGLFRKRLIISAASAAERTRREFMRRIFHSIIATIVIVLQLGP